jgi:hypothetical protein
MEPLDLQLRLKVYHTALPARRQKSRVRQEQQSTRKVSEERGGPLKMEPVRIVLCSQCEHCPEVVINDEGVSIGEDQNVVKLRHAEWNELVARIRSGELAEV